MLLALIACCSCALLAYYSYRTTQQVPSSEGAARVCLALRAGRPLSQLSSEGEVDDEVRELLSALRLAKTRQAAVAALNEFISYAQAESTRQAEVPRTLGRACLSLGMLLAVLAVAKALSSALPVNTAELVPALLAAAAGILGGLFCYQVGHKANERRRTYREQVRTLSKLLQRHLPEEGS